MMLADEFCSNDFRDIKEALIMQNIINIFSVLQIVSPCFPGLFIFSLLFLEPQPHVANARFVRTFGG